MSLYVVTPIETSRRSDGKNLFVVSAGSGNAARASAEAMCGETAGAFAAADWPAVALTDTPGQDFVAECAGPVGKKNGPWLHLTRGGNPLAI